MDDVVPGPVYRLRATAIASYCDSSLITSVNAILISVGVEYCPILLKLPVFSIGVTGGDTLVQLNTNPMDVGTKTSYSSSRLSSYGSGPTRYRKLGITRFWLASFINPPTNYERD